ncbi:type II secretion system F family protein [Lignipirellula cremea]|uniref:Bacterial type II secretion system protein F domain protein n=1 Tax=Lignipirellula cremea TaxID=2528010 RepID=A0A518E1P9_9BACT|nr:type II secretion system F family protein [Lignipirellula cremea]QDU98018.1 Bacterial type II secretion system protein F domain protein [Lignipirellula cremea]
MPFEAVVISLLGGLCAAGAGWAGQGAYHQFIDYVERDLAERLKSLRIVSSKLRWWIQIWLAIVAMTFIVLWLGFDAALFGVVAAIFMCAGPWFVVRRMAAARRLKVEEQLADAMVMFSSAVRAGLSLAQALELLATDCPKPIQQEFAQMVGEYKMGKPLERTLTEAKERLRSENFILFSAALLASRESGGRLNETVERISASVIELQRLERKVRSETAQARKSAVYMGLAPPAILAAYYVMSPDVVEALFTDFAGQAILCAAVLLNVAAYFWAVAILDADI